MLQPFAILKTMKNFMSGVANPIFWYS